MSHKNKSYVLTDYLDKPVAVFFFTSLEEKDLQCLRALAETYVGELHDLNVNFMASVEPALALTQTLLGDSEEEQDKDECLVCAEKLDPTNGDNWDSLCPSCADKVSEYMDLLGMFSVERDEAIARVKEQGGF